MKIHRTYLFYDVSSDDFTRWYTTRLCLVDFVLFCPYYLPSSFILRIPRSPKIILLKNKYPKIYTKPTNNNRARKLLHIVPAQIARRKSQFLKRPYITTITNYNTTLYNSKITHPTLKSQNARDRSADANANLHVGQPRSVPPLEPPIASFALGIDSPIVSTVSKLRLGFQSQPPPHLHNDGVGSRVRITEEAATSASMASFNSRRC